MRQDDQIERSRATGPGPSRPGHRGRHAPARLHPGGDRDPERLAALRRWTITAPDHRARPRPLGDEPVALLLPWLGRLRRHLAGEPGAALLLDHLDRAMAPLAGLSRRRRLPPPVARDLEDPVARAEAMLGRPFVRHAERALDSVGRIAPRGANGSAGCGVLVAPGVLLTARTVLSDMLAAARCTLSLRFGTGAGVRTFRLRPGRLFHTDARLGVTLVAVDPAASDGTPLAAFGHLALVGEVGKIRPGYPVHVAGHRADRLVRIVTDDAILLALPPDPGHLAQYGGDTTPGSAGAPVLSDRGEMVALHLRGVPATDTNGRILTLDGGVWDRARDPRMQGVRWIGNEGVRVSALVRHLRGVRTRIAAHDPSAAALLGAVLAVGDGADRAAPLRPDPAAPSPCARPAGRPMTPPRP